MVTASSLPLDTVKVVPFKVPVLSMMVIEPSLFDVIETAVVSRTW
jgi:hypothetical protein